MTSDDEPVHRAAGTPSHIVGERLDDLSVADFDERIALLRTEIERLEAAKRLKQEARARAGSVFGP